MFEYCLLDWPVVRNFQRGWVLDTIILNLNSFNSKRTWTLTMFICFQGVGWGGGKGYEPLKPPG